MGLIMHDDVAYGGGGGSSLEFVELTKVQYDALTNAQKHDLTKVYCITDWDVESSIIDDTATSLNTTWSSSKIDSEISGNAYTLPTASDSVLGGVKVGSNLSIDENGVLSANGSSYTLPMASDSVLGGIKVGNNLSINANGVLSSQPFLFRTYNVGWSITINLGQDVTLNNTSDYYFEGNGVLNHALLWSDAEQALLNINPKFTDARNLQPFWVQLVKSGSSAHMICPAITNTGNTTRYFEMYGMVFNPSPNKITKFDTIIFSTYVYYL